MAFKTASELVVFSTGTFIDNINGDISPLDFRNMHQHIADSLIPYDASGVYGVKVLPTGNVITPTPTGYLVYDNGLKIYNGVQWSGVSGGSGGSGTTYTAGTGLQLSGTVFNALTASTSVTGVTILTNTIDASQNKALTPKAVNDAGYVSTAGSGLTISGSQIYTEGTGNFSAIDLATTGTLPYKEGRLFYDTDNKSLAFYNDESDISLQVGQENWVRVRNNTGSTITNGTVVIVSGVQGSNMEISRAIASSFIDSNILGLATHDIEDSSFGYITTFGLVRNIDTSALTEGELAYLSPTSSGVLSSSKPGLLNYSVAVGTVVRSHASTGSIFLRPTGPRFGGGQVSNSGTQLSGVPFIIAKGGNDVAIHTVVGFTYDSGNSLFTAPSMVVTDSGNFGRTITVGSGVQLLAGTPDVTTNKLYNVGGVLYFNGSGVSQGGGGGGGAGYDWVFGDGSGNTETIASGDSVYASGTGSVTTSYNTSTNVLTINGTDTTYTAGTGLALNGSEFSTAGTGYFDALVLSDSGNVGGVLTTNKAVKTSIKSNPDGATITFDLNESNTHYATLGGANRIIAVSNPTVGQKFILRLQQDGTGNRTVTWFNTIKWDGATTPTLSTSGNRADLFGFLCTSGNHYDGMVLAQNLG